MKEHSFALVPVTDLRSVVNRAPRAATIGPGWFDSSWDLRCGLEVVEEDQADVALRAWIDSILGAVSAQPRLARVASPSAITAIA